MLEGIVGREYELRAVQSFLASVATRPSALLIEGEPGIGKTTLWCQAVGAAEARDFRVLQARVGGGIPIGGDHDRADVVGAVLAAKDDRDRVVLSAACGRVGIACVVRPDLVVART
jgi:hypothetical protein